MTATLRDDGDLKYYTNITLNDQVFPVLIDTGRCASVWPCMFTRPLTLGLAAPTCT